MGQFVTFPAPHSPTRALAVLAPRPAAGPAHTFFQLLLGGVMHYTFNTDWRKPAAQQCGRVVFSDFHVTTTGHTDGVTFPSECSSSDLTSQEKVLA